MYRIQIEQTVTKDERTKDWQHVGEGKGPDGRDYDYVETIRPVTKTTTIFNLIIEDVDINDLIQTVVSVVCCTPKGDA